MDKLVSNCDESQKQSFQEMCILVNEKDEVLGQDSKLNCHKWDESTEEKSKLHRAFSVLLFNSKNELLIQKRASGKVTFPLYWANTCCSHPLYTDEELDMNNNIGVIKAAIRRLSFELGIPKSELNISDFHVVDRFLYKARSNEYFGEHELDYILCIKKDITLNINPNEVDSIQYLNEDNLNNFMNNTTELISPWFKLIWKNYIPQYYKFEWLNKTNDKLIEIKTLYN